MKAAEFLSEMEDALELNVGTLKPGVELGELKIWDSMQQLVFIARAEELTGIVVPGEIVGSAKTVDDLIAAVSDGLTE